MFLEDALTALLERTEELNSSNSLEKFFVTFVLK